MIRLVGKWVQSSPVPIAKIPPDGAPLAQLQLGKGDSITIPNPIEQGWIYQHALFAGMSVKAISGYERVEKGGEEKIGKFWENRQVFYIFSDEEISEITVLAALTFKVPFLRNWQASILVPSGFEALRVENLGLNSDSGHLELAQTGELLTIIGSACCCLKPNTEAIAFGQMIISPLELLGEAFTFSFAETPPTFAPTTMSWMGNAYRRSLFRFLIKPGTFTWNKSNYRLVALKNK